MFDFSSGPGNNSVMLANPFFQSAIYLCVQDLGYRLFAEGSSFDLLTWTHVVATVSGTVMKVYKNGELVVTSTYGREPLVMTRTQHWLGRSAWVDDGYLHGTIG